MALLNNQVCSSGLEPAEGRPQAEANHPEACWYVYVYPRHQHRPFNSINPSESVSHPNAPPTREKRRMGVSPPSRVVPMVSPICVCVVVEGMDAYERPE